MPSARTIKARNGKYYKSNAESIRSSEPLVSNIVLIRSPKTEPLVSNIRLIQSAKIEPLVSNIGLIQSAKGEPLVSNIGLIQSPKGGPLVSNIGLIQSPNGGPLVSNIVLIQSPKREPLVSNIIIILGETRLPHSLAKPDCYARSNSSDNCRCWAFRLLALIAHPTSGSVQLRQNRTYCDHDLTSCAFRCAATAAVSESRRALRANDVFLLMAQ